MRSILSLPIVARCLETISLLFIIQLFNSINSIGHIYFIFESIKF